MTSREFLEMIGCATIGNVIGGLLGLLIMKLLGI